MASWADLVTTALLGTDRRSVPDELSGAWANRRPGEVDPARTVLGLAARHRAVARAGGLLGSCPPVAGAPPPGPVAGEVATSVLDGLLARPSTALLGLWLRAAADHRVTVSPEQWARLAGIAARDPGLERRVLAVALGPRGVWFVGQNPQWSRLFRTLSDPGQAAATRSGAEPGTAAPPAADDVADNPWLLADLADPWPDDLLLAGLESIAAARLGYRSVAYAIMIGARMPLGSRPLVATTIERLGVGHAGGGFTAERLVRESFEALQAAVEARLAIAAAFDADAATEPVGTGTDQHRLTSRDRGAQR